MEKKTYSYDEAFEASLQYFQGDELAARVWVNKYAVKDSFGNIYERSPEDMHWRIANEVARIEAKYPNPLSAEELFGLLDHFRYIVPQGSPMTGIGNDHQVASLSNCFVIGIDGQADSYGAIFKIDEEQVQLMKRRGGVGHDLSHIRPKGSPVKNSALTSTGLVPFMERYSNSTREVAQDGRRGALMLSVSIKHPDAEAFIDAKMTEGKVTGANVSVKLDDDFMRAATEDRPYVQQYPIHAAEPLVRKEISASALWKKIIHNAWKSAEPGVLFWDTILRESVPDCYADLGFRTVSTNPCGEIPLCPYDSCRLLAINLYSYVVNPFKPDAYFDFDLFKKHVALAQRIMDDIIDLELEKIERIQEKIDSDPECEDVKHTERTLWQKIFSLCNSCTTSAWIWASVVWCFILFHLLFLCTFSARAPIGTIGEHSLRESVFHPCGASLSAVAPEAPRCYMVPVWCLWCLSSFSSRKQAVISALFTMKICPSSTVILQLS